MGKLIGGLGFVVLVCVTGIGRAQDPFSIQSYEPSDGQPASLILELPPAQEEPPIIQSPPVRKTQYVENRGPLKSRVENAHVRTGRTPAQDYIQQRAIYLAQQRTYRIEQRKAFGTSMLRPGDPVRPWWYDPEVPVWYSVYLK